MDASWLVNSLLTVALAAAVFTLIFVWSQKYIRRLLSSNTPHKQVVSICMRLTSGLQGVLCTLSGIIIINSCDDLIHQSHWLTETYVLVGTGYLLYDTWATYLCFLLDRPELCERPLVDRVATFVKADPAMMFHHLGLPVIFLPTVMYFRRGLGDGLIGCFMLIEATVPFISLREILVLLKQQTTWLYLANGVCTVVVYTASRVLIFPWMFWLYGRQISTPWYKVPLIVPRVCVMGSSVFAALYIYWWFMIFGIARTELRDWFSKRNSHSAVTTEGVGPLIKRSDRSKED